MGKFEVRDDGLYKIEYFDETTEISKLILSKEALEQAMFEWYGIAPQYCKHYSNGKCLNRSQHLSVGCCGHTVKCENGTW